MNNVPHWQVLVVIYFILVAVPVYLVHVKLKARAYARRTLFDLLLYFAGMLGTAFIMHSICMWVYFRFFFRG